MQVDHSHIKGVWFGEDFRDRPHVDGSAVLYFLDQQRAIEHDGRIAAFSVYVKRTCPLQLVIYRKDGNGFRVIGKDALWTPTQLGENVVPLAQPIPVQAADLIGWHQTQQGVIAVDVPDGVWARNDLLGRILIGVEYGAETQFNRSSNRVYSIQVLLERRQ